MDKGRCLLRKFLVSISMYRLYRVPAKSEKLVAVECEHFIYLLLPVFQIKV